MRGAFAFTILLLCAADAAAMTGNAPPASGGYGRAIVMIQGPRESVCTGTAITHDIVLTAAHCAQGMGLSVVPYLGARPIAVVKTAVHPRFSMDAYTKSRATADVALLKLAETLPERVVPATLAELPQRSTAKPGDTFVIAGFGTTRADSATGLGQPRMARLTATGQPGNLQLRLFDATTRGVQAGLGACTGDSGGPVFASSDNGNTAQLVGIVAWSTGPNLAAGCGGLTGVTPLNLYRGWVVESVKKLGSER